MSDPTATPRPLAGVRVLLVEDDDDSREMFGVMLEHAGAAVTGVASAELAFEAFGRETPDVVVSDLGLPQEDGWSLIKTIRRLARERDAQISAVAVSGHAYPADIADSLRAGFDLHLSKPVGTGDLIEAITGLVAAEGRRVEPEGRALSTAESDDR